MSRFGVASRFLAFFAPILLVGVAEALSPAAAPAQTITSLSQSLGASGTPITISGTGFGAAQGSSTVAFGSVQGAPSSWSDTSIVVPVPASLAAGDLTIFVTVGGVSSNGAAFTVIPVIFGLSTYSGSPGTAITISGGAFGATQGSSTIALNGLAATASSWSNASIVTSVPAGATTGPLIVTVNGLATNAVNFTVPTPAPTISSLSPTAGPIGAPVTITGTNFGDMQGGSRVLFAGHQGSPATSPTSWSATSITVPVPAGAISGGVAVAVNGQVSNFIRFTVSTLNITAMSPTSGAVGTSVTISGAGFGSTQGSSTVTFNGTAATPSSWSDTQIIASVPTGATTGNLVVTVSGIASNGINFIVGTPPRITASASPAPNSVGWNNSNVTVTLTCTAGSSPVVSCPAPQIVSSEGGGQVISGTATDANGLTATTSVTLSIDKTPPTLTGISPADGAQASSSPLTVSGSVSDALSGVSAVTCNGAAATISSGTFSCNLSLNVGVNLVVIRATDAAGNVAGSNFHVSLAGALPPPQSLQVSPATVNLLVAETQQFTAVDERGRPRADATWSVDNTSVATLSTDPTTPSLLAAVAPGTATLTATIGSVTAQAQINILSGTSLAPGTVRWSAPSTPGFTVQQIAQAVPTNGGPDLYSIETDDNSTPLIRALTADGQQQWVTTFAPGQYGYGVFGSPNAAMPDGNGGILIKLLANPGTFPQTLQVVDVDAQTGTPIWASDSGFNSTPLTSQMAIRQDGTIFKVDGFQGQPALIGMDPATGATVSAFTAPPGALTGTSCPAVFTPLGRTFGTLSPPTVGPDGTVNSVVTRLDVVTEGCDSSFEQTLSSLTQTLSLLQVAPDGSASVSPLRQDTNVQQPANSFTGQLVLALQPNSLINRSAIRVDFAQAIPQAQAYHVIPDGQGGVLAPYVFSSALPTSYQQRVAHFTGSIVQNDFALPLTPTSNPEQFPMVLGENGTAFAANRQLSPFESSPQPRFVASFNVNSGQANWTYQASTSGASLIAATDGGGLAISNSSTGTISLDAAGNPTQISSPNALTFPSYSWKGQWNGLAASSSQVVGVSLPFLETLTSFWANPMGGPSNNGAAGRPWYFILNWQNDFYFFPDKPAVREDLKVDITDRATLIKNAALTALKQAYSGQGWPVVVVEGSPNTGDKWAAVQSITEVEPTACGITTTGQAPPKRSDISYECAMKEAQSALQVVINTAQDESQALGRDDLIQAIGRGVGNIAAHEIAHLFLALCCGMDAKTSADPNSAGTYNNGSSSGDTNPAVYTGYAKDGKPIHWEDVTKQVLAKCLGAGYKNYGLTTCVAAL